MFFRACAALVGSVFAAAPTCVASTVRVLPWLRHLPEAAVHAYRVTWQTPKIGPTLKVVVSIAMIPGVGVVAPLTLVGAAGYGVVGGMIDTFRSILDGNRDRYTAAGKSKGWGPMRTLARMNKAGKDLVEEMMPKLRHYTPPALKEGETPFDISILQGLKALISGLCGTAIEAPGVLVIALRHTPNIVWKGIKTIWSEGGRAEIVMLPVQVFMTLMWIVIVAVLLALAPLVTVAGTLGLQVYRGYSKGLRAAWASVIDDLRKVNDVLSGDLDKRRWEKDDEDAPPSASTPTAAA